MLTFRQKDCSINKLRAVRKIAALLLLLFIPFTKALAQQTHPYAGVWFMKSNNTSYYVVPGANPQVNNKLDAFFSGDPEMPFLTTYNTSGDINSIWILEPVSQEDNYYFIIHALTGKYLKYEIYLNGDNARRKFVHLETIATPGETEKFEITEYSNGVKIKPKNSELYLNVAGGNQDRYNGGTTSPYHSGMIGGMSGTDGNSCFKLVDASTATALTPVIGDVDENNNISITSPAAAFTTIRYTTDGITTPDANTGLTATSGSDIIITSDWSVQAVGVFGAFSTPVAGPKNLLPNFCVPPVISFDYITSTVSITCATPGATIYYTTNGDTPTASSSQYSGAITVTSPTTVKAIATHNVLRTSDVTSKAIEQVATPVIQNNGSNAISITSATQDATIYYTLDGSTPTTSSTLYTEPLHDNVSNVTIKAIAVKESMITSAVGSGAVTLYCDVPVILRSGDNSFTITCQAPASGVTIYYTTDGSTPTTSGNSTEPGIPIPCSFPVTVKAIATATGYDNSLVADATLELIMGGEGSEANPYTIEFQGDLDDFFDKANTMAGSSMHYKVISESPLDLSGANSVTLPFSGTFDGGHCILTGLNHPLFNTVDGGTVKNVMLKGVSISSSADTIGAIAGIAKGYSRIYNCGILPGSPDYPDGIHPSVSTSGNCAGSLVGSLRGDSRVVNCFSYADVSAGNTAAGIVGKNTFASTALETDGKYTELRTMVVNCMFYGNITAANIYPVYGGLKITNTGATAINNYNFYRNDCIFTGTLTDYNCSWPAQERFLTRNEYYRSLLNSNRELCGWWVGAPSAPSGMTTTQVQSVPKDASLMAKWVLDPSEAPYPILRPFGKYASAVNIDADASWRTTANEWEGRKLGTVSVTINPGTHAANGVTATAPIGFTVTDMDTLREDFCYRKIQLPYYNTVFGDPEGDTWTLKYGGNYGEYVVTGWEITTTNGAAGTFVNSGDDAWQNGYNFADRKGSAKDTYSSSGRIFAQGGYYYVPDDVTAITITAHWAKAVYLDNAGNSYDRVYLSDSESNSGTHFAPAGTRSALGNGQTVKTGTINSAITSGGSVYGNAIVLVGNYQYRNAGGDIKGNNNTSGTSIMSIDMDCDDEPDYCLEWQLGNKYTRQSFCPIRFDFLTVIELGMALKEDGSTQYYSLGCFRPLGHFEVTETSLIHFGQFEFGNSSRSTEAPIILNGGIFDQYTKGTESIKGANDHISYIILGGNLSMPSFTPGAHVKNTANYPTRHCAVNVLGGTIDNLYLTGNYNENVTPNTDNPHCYIDGGRIKHVAAAGKEGIDGDVYFHINHSKIWEFYGGSTLATKLVTGHINITIDNSIVQKYCGGPKFGDMASGKTITTNASNTVFNVYYGGGNGGTSYVQYKPAQDNTTTAINYNWEATGKNQGHVNEYNASAYVDLNDGYQANYDMEIVNISSGTEANEAVFRTYYYAAQFSATNTGSITNNLTGCTVLTNFYGAGNLGGVHGDVTSTLTDTHVLGSAFGAGFSATIPNVTIYNRDKNTPTINLQTGVITPQSGGTSTTYTWTNETSLGGQTLSTARPAVTGVTIDGDTRNYFYTEVSLDNLGAVSGAVSLTITGTDNKGSVVGNVYGGGDASTVSNSTDPDNASTTVNIQGNTTVMGDVFGGGNRGDVSGSVTVNIQSGTIENDVYGGGALANTNIGNVTAGYGTDNETIPSTTTSTTTVNLTGGIIRGDAYGGGLGSEGIAAKVYGDITVYQLGTILVPAYTDSIAIRGRIFGCNNVNGTPKGHVLVYIENTVKASNSDTYAISAVYGGGNMAEYVPYNIDSNDSEFSEVIVDGCNTATIHSVYGGGNAASTPATQVTISGAKEIKYVFGGGNGAGADNPGANVGYHHYDYDGELGGTSPEDIQRRLQEEGLAYGSGVATTNIYGGHIHYVYGGSNTKGNIRKASVSMLDELSDCELHIDGIYGGGREAYMEGKTSVELGCITGMEAIYGGSENADVGSDVNLTITSGHFDHVFGGNNKGGRIFGSITVNIEQTGCVPISIDEIYLGGNNAPYSVFGYGDSVPRQNVGTELEPELVTHFQPIEGDENHPQLYHDPILHIRSFESIGTIYGGGNGKLATMVGSPTVEINVTGGWVNGQYGGGKDEYSQYVNTPMMLSTDGVIDTVYGGGNAAKVIGSTNVLIGDSLSLDATLNSMSELYKKVGNEGLKRNNIMITESSQNDVKSITYTVVNDENNPVAGKQPLTVNIKQTVNGVTITGNVYGGGNQADVTDSTNIQVGPAIP